MLLSLALVPLPDIENAYNVLYDDIPEELVPVATYFDETYLTGKRSHGRRRDVPPKYSPQLRNCHDSTLQNAHRFNKISEGFHNRFRVVVGKHHPSLYGCHEEFLKEQADTETLLTQTWAKTSRPPLKRSGLTHKFDSDASWQHMQLQGCHKISFSKFPDFS